MQHVIASKRTFSSADNAEKSAKRNGKVFVKTQHLPSGRFCYLHRVTTGETTMATASTKTYSRRENARRAAIKAGIPKDQVKITVHKNDGEVRFGYKAAQQPPQATSAATATPTPATNTKRPQRQHAAAAGKAQRPERNGIKRPAAGGACATVWEYLDKHPATTAKQIREAATAAGWNLNNALCELYQWRKFHGVSGRVKAKS